MEYKKIKKTARNNLKRHYFRNLIVVFICSFLLTGGVNYTTKNIFDVNISGTKDIGILQNYNLTNSDIINELLEKSGVKTKIKDNVDKKYTRGICSYLINQMTRNHSLIFALLNGINKLVFENKIAVSIIIILSNILFFIFNVIFINTIEVGKNRYFLEQRKYYDTKIDSIFFPYRVKKTFHIAYILFLKSLYKFFWSLTIILGFVKHYEYFMIPYLLAENPNLSKKEVFKLSKEITNGHKLELFYLDLSLFGFTMLRILTFNVSAIFYSNIYKEVIYSESYMVLSKNVQFERDFILDPDVVIKTRYPKSNYQIKSRKWLNIDYTKTYTVKTYILLFFTFSILGWFWEVLFTFLETGNFVNRGTMYGPWLPIYGYGGILILFLLKKYRQKPVYLFILTVILCGILEYATGWYLEVFKHLKYWDYSGYFLNINGRICLEGLLFFGLGGCSFTYILAPVLDNLYKKINYKVSIFLCILLLLLYSFDLVYTRINPNKGNGITILVNTY